MDDDIRRRRAQDWYSADHSRTSDLSTHDDTAEKYSAAERFSFGHVAPVTQEPFVSVAENDLESDEETMRRQLGRQSAPYSYVPPPVDRQQSVKREPSSAPTPSPTQAPPGSYPREDYGGGESETKQHDRAQKAEEPDVKVKSEPEHSADERTCRICFSPEAPEEKLISPCKCRGTSKWIHIDCLNQWRNHSQNSKSFYRCDQCHYEYSFRRTDLAKILLSRWTLLGLTLGAFTAATFVGGFIVKFGLFLLPPEYLLGNSGWSSNFSFFYTPLDAGTDMLSAASALIPSTPRVWRDIFVVDVWHFMQGIISLGIIGIVGFMGTGGLFSLRTFHPRRTRRQGDGLGFTELAFIAVILLGCGKVGFSMWQRVQRMVKKRLADLGERILEVDPDRA